MLIQSISLPSRASVQFPEVLPDGLHLTCGRLLQCICASDYEVSYPCDWVNNTAWSKILTRPPPEQGLGLDPGSVDVGRTLPGLTIKSPDQNVAVLSPDQKIKTHLFMPSLNFSIITLGKLFAYSKYSFLILKQCSLRLMKEENHHFQPFQSRSKASGKKTLFILAQNSWN